jgi:hypothetical protein
MSSDKIQRMLENQRKREQAMREKEEKRRQEEEEKKKMQQQKVAIDPSSATRLVKTARLDN